MYEPGGEQEPISEQFQRTFQEVELPVTQKRPDGTIFTAVFQGYKLLPGRSVDAKKLQEFDLLLKTRGTSFATAYVRNEDGSIVRIPLNEGGDVEKRRPGGVKEPMQGKVQLAQVGFQLGVGAAAVYNVLGGMGRNSILRMTGKNPTEVIFRSSKLPRTVPGAVSSAQRNIVEEFNNPR